MLKVGATPDGAKAATAKDNFVGQVKAVGDTVKDYANGVIGIWVGGGELAARVTRQARSLPPGQFRLAGERSDILDILPAFDVSLCASGTASIRIACRFPSSSVAKMVTPVVFPPGLASDRTKP